MATRTTRTRSSYHHGDLRAALVAAGEELARKGGPGAIVLREVTRTVGVAPNAVYAHFATLAELKIAVSRHALRAMAAAMSVHLGQVPEPADPREAAKVHLREVGRAYVLFALAEPGLFRAAMDDNPASGCVPGEGDRGRGDRASDEPSGPATLLIAALDRLTRAGCLPAEETDAAVMACWATVHGLATLLLNLLPTSSRAEREAAIEAGLHYLLQGLTLRG
ncbi:TetR/AcrR family transcriptional regulator [Streptomyces paromomycinus]|uniref:TetR family transcriptional regulator n=1 Tax=Streptomyces paromomycinus TaxID=92743 RepID=A0A401VTP1_STREY|nr:TetR/AcrR family transcriptional regulator [Streptomyces paromomycinus]GCD40451.1 TetR family transcriptional regulator [Streptomyces paromomycinus]